MAGQLAGRGEQAGSLGQGRGADHDGADARRAARAGAPRAGRPGQRARRGAAGRPEGPNPARPEAGPGRRLGVARPRPARAGRAAVRGPLQRERGQAAAQGPRPLLAEGAAGPPRGRPEGAGALQKKLPDLIRGVADRHPEAGRVELWFMDETRVGQKGRLTHVWYQKGARPRGVRQQGFASAHLFGAVCPERGEGVALVLPEVSTAAMDVFLTELSRAVPAGTHAALVLDG